MRATAAFGGGLELPRGATQVAGCTRHRGTCLFGQGAARLKVDTVAGWLRVSDPHETANPPEEFAGPTELDPSLPSAPPPPPPIGGEPHASPRDVAGEAMGDSGMESDVFGRSSGRFRAPGSGDDTDDDAGGESRT